MLKLWFYTLKNAHILTLLHKIISYQGTTIAVSYSDCAWDLFDLYTGNT